MFLRSLIDKPRKPIKPSFLLALRDAKRDEIVTCQHVKNSCLAVSRLIAITSLEFLMSCGW
jgi:hypothetical protein